MKLNLTKEQEQLLKIALCSFITEIHDDYNYDLGKNNYYDDLMNQVWEQGVLEGHLDYEPWKEVYNEM